MTSARLTPWLVAALTLGATAAQADDGGRRRPLLPAYAQECAACHIAFAPGLLPAQSWQRLMAGLRQHFGTDASLDAPLREQIASWLQANAGRGVRASTAPPQDRISRAAWFEREHREVDASTWARKSIGSASNCTACHADAATGRFDDDNVRIPR